MTYFIWNPKRMMGCVSNFVKKYLRNKPERLQSDNFLYNISYSIQKLVRVPYDKIRIPHCCSYPSLSPTIFSENVWLNSFKFGIVIYRSNFHTFTDRLKTLHAFDIHMNFRFWIILNLRSLWNFHLRIC